MEVSDVKDRTTKLETDIFSLIQDYEVETGVSVTDLDCSRMGQVGTKQTCIYGIRARVELW